jgi:hypothetical protein
LNSEHHGTLTGIEKYSQEEFDEHTQAGMSGNQPIGNASHITIIPETLAKQGIPGQNKEK